MIDPGLKDKVAVVTGGNNPHGMGAAIARAFAAQGARVFVNYLRLAPEERGVSAEEAALATEPGMPFYAAQSGKSPDEVVQSVREAGGEVEAWQGDLAEAATIPRLFDRAEEVFGPVDILVNNAAYSRTPDTILSLTPEIVDRHFAVNARAVVLMMAEFARRFKARGGVDGRIISISTDSAQCFPTHIAYGASKAALEAFTRSVGCEVAPFGITVNAVAPGPIQTGAMSAASIEREEADIPLGRVGAPEDIANAVIFLASAQADWITGKVLRVDGGHICSP
jgi:3-oxoacyl-[acyl-carrier protein] reductase